MQRLIVATQNAGKLREFRQLLHHYPFEVRDAAGMPPVEETGDTYAENAALKARAAAEWSGEWALADDSGLEVDALEGAPGILSTRFGGPASTEASRNALLLERLGDRPRSQRTARYRAACALCSPDGRVFLGEGSCEGLILSEGRGEQGFGYDPLFWLPERGCTMAELSPEAKNSISHRARALAALAPALTTLLRGEHDE